MRFCPLVLNNHFSAAKIMTISTKEIRTTELSEWLFTGRSATKKRSKQNGNNNSVDKGVAVNIPTNSQKIMRDQFHFG